MANNLRPLLAVFLVLRRDRKLLLARRDGTSHMCGLLGLPSGHIEEGETPEEALVRETKEETGIDLDPEAVMLVHTQFNASSGLGREYINLYFVPLNEEELLEPNITEPDMCSEHVWVDWETLELPSDTISYVAIALHDIHFDLVSRGEEVYHSGAYSEVRESTR